MNRLVPISVAVSLPLLSALAFGQEYRRERLPKDVREADLIAVGTLSGVWTYPWLDGWHRRGTINVQRVLFQTWAKIRRAARHLDFEGIHDDLG